MAVKAPVIVHGVARCRWCGAQFMQVYGSQWVCRSQICRERQVKYAVRRTGAVKHGESPFLYLPTPAQVELHECRTKRLLWGGAAGGAKSHGLRWNIYRSCLTIPGYEALLLRRTFPELEKTHLRRMAQEAPLLGADFVESKRLMRFPGTKALLEVGHCEDDRAMSLYLSTEYDEIAIDEASTFEANQLIELSKRARSNKPAVNARSVDGVDGAHFRLTSNPGGPGALFLRDAYIVKNREAIVPELMADYYEDEYDFNPARITDNPHLNVGYARDLDQMREGRRRQLRDGDWDVFEAQFFPEWRAEKDGSPWHVADLDAEAEGTPLVGGIDWGYNQPGCMLWARVLADGRMYVQADWKFQGCSVESVAAGIRRRTDELRVPRFSALYCDPSMGNKTGFGQSGQAQAESHAEVFARLGLPMIRSDNDRYHGWQRVHDYLRAATDGRPWLIVSPRCRYLTRSLPTLQQDKHDPDDLDTTADDHACVTGDTIIATERGPVPIQDVTTSDRVWTSQGLKRVLASGQTGTTRRLTYVKPFDCPGLFCTPNHPIATADGQFVRADAIGYDMIQVWPHPTSTETPAPSGASIMARFRLAIISIISTAIRAITTSPIWRAGRAVSIWPFMGVGAFQTWCIWRASARSPWPGIDPILDVTGTADMPSGSGWVWHPTSPSTAMSVIQRSSIDPRVVTRASVGTPVSPNGGVISNSTTNPDPVPAAARRSAAENICTPDIVRVSVAQTIDTKRDTPVYNLTVEGCHEYFANGILTHNCDALRYLLAGRPAPGQTRKPVAAETYGTMGWWKRDRTARRPLTIGHRQ